VLLLEAGPEAKAAFWIGVPMGFPMLFANRKVNWMFETEGIPELNGRRTYQPRGKVLGGTSAINGMVYIRGHARDYDLWRQRGCTGWGFDDVLPYFKKAEDQERGADAYHGVGGPLAVTDPRGGFPVADAFVAAAQQAGIPYTADFNGAQQEGVGFYQTTIRGGRRWSTAEAYLRPARRRKNLKIVTDAHATRVLIEGGRAAGIEYRSPAGLMTARARGEVVLSGGAFGSPQLLLLSGIGPGDHLRDLGIPTRLHAPQVGANLADHFCVTLMFSCTNVFTLNDLAGSWFRQMAAGLQWVLFKRGMLASTGIFGGVFTRTDQRFDRPDLQINACLWTVRGRSDKGIERHPHPGISMNSVHLNPSSSGTVRLKSADPLAPPEIRLNFLTTPEDVAAMVAGTRIARAIVGQPAMASYVTGEISPGPDVKTDAEIEAYVRATGIPNLHPVGTCRMGTDDTCVVDPELRVRGVRGLRVADASIMPALPAGNTNAPSIMIGEKASEMILAAAREWSARN
jgi:choline dehydrogenase